jgi:hypothetical protein
VGADIVEGVEHVSAVTNEDHPETANVAYKVIAKRGNFGFVSDIQPALAKNEITLFLEDGLIRECGLIDTESAPVNVDVDVRRTGLWRCSTQKPSPRSP